MYTHRDRQLHHGVHGLNPRGWRVEPEQRCQQRRALGTAGGALVHHFDLISFEHRNIDELARFFAAVMLDHQQAGRRHFEHEAQNRNGAGCPPDGQPVLVAPNTQMHPRAFDGGCHPRKRSRSERQKPFENERVPGLLRREERQ